MVSEKGLTLNMDCLFVTSNVTVPNVHDNDYLLVPVRTKSSIPSVMRHETDGLVLHNCEQGPTILSASNGLALWAH